MVRKSVLITGCSEGGIGDALAKQFHKIGLRVFATARNPAKLQHLKDLGLETITLDVTDEVSIKEAVKSVSALTGGTLDILVNNSGGGLSLPLLDAKVADAKKMFDINVFGLMAVTQAFVPLLIASKGTILNIGSVAGKAPVPWQGYYNASKAAVNLLGDQLRIELSPWDVKCINVVTGGVKSKFFENLTAAPKLPEDSLYYPAREEVEPVMRGDTFNDGATDVDEYAAAVVSNALKSSPIKQQWLGSSAWPIWFVGTFGWQTIWDTVVPGTFKFSAIIKKIRAAEQAN